MVGSNAVHSDGFQQLLAQMKCSLIFTTYQAGQLGWIGQTKSQLQFGFSKFNKPMGLTRTASGISLATKNEIWNFRGERALATQIEPLGQYDLALLCRSSHITGPVMTHDIVFGNGKLIIVNTLCNCLATIDEAWSFVPQWKPPFIADTTPGDRCHLNGLALDDRQSAPAYVTMHAATSELGQWRENKRAGGVVMDVQANEILAANLSMPHSPRVQNNQLYLLNSGEGQLLRINRHTGEKDIIAELPGFTRGLDVVGSTAFVGLSRIRETAVFGGLSIAQKHEELQCGIAVVNLVSGNTEAFCWFEPPINELFSIAALPGYLNPIIAPASGVIHNDVDRPIWSLPPPSM